MPCKLAIILTYGASRVINLTLSTKDRYNMAHRTVHTNSAVPPYHILALLQKDDIEQHVTVSNICLACEQVFGTCFSFNVWSARSKPEKFYQEMRKLALTDGRNEQCFPTKVVRNRHQAQQFLKALYDIARSEQTRIRSTSALCNGGNFIMDI